MSKKEHKYDIFISYRRAGGAQYARILQLMLQQRGYRVFLDYDELTDGIFGEHIKAAIKDASIFMPVLSKGCMERCLNEDDWLRQEIQLAMQEKKHLVPVNPDNSFDGFPEGMSEDIKTFIGSHQYSEISFGQALGATIDLMVKNRLAPTLGERTASQHQDQDYKTAQETLRKQDAHNRFMKRAGIASAIAIIAIVLVTCFWFMKNQNDKDEAEALAAQIDDLRKSLEEKHSSFLLQLNHDLSKEQMAVIDTLLDNMTEVYPDSIWMSQYEFTIGQWHTILGEPFDNAQKDIPKTGISFGDIYMFLSKLGDMTNITFELPSAEVWEYAAHGGLNNETTIYAGDNDVDKVAWYKDNAGGRPHPSDGQQGKEPNTLDLYDMSGNVSEMCNTPFDDSGRYTVCGGNFNSPASEVTITSRSGFDTNSKGNTIGFRVIIRKP